MTPEETNAYQRGYRNGRKRRKLDDANRNKRIADAAFEDRAFLAALPVTLSNNIVAGDEKADKFTRQISAAWWIAGEALQQRKRRRY